MKKILPFLIPIFLLSFVACGGGEDKKNFNTLYDAFLSRGNDVEGYEVTEIGTYDGFDFFCVRVCLNTDDAVTVDDYMWFEANVMLYSSQEEADAAYELNLNTGLGGSCLQQGKILIYWMEQDPFADLYKEVFNSVFE